MVSEIICVIWGVGGLFGIGTFPQVNAITHAMQDTFNVPVVITATVVTVLVAMIILGGVRRIARASAVIVPFMALGYVTTSIIILIVNYDKLPAAISLIIQSAFNPQAALGGAVGFYRDESHSIWCGARYFLK